jgi:hypothetical protein
VLWSGAPDCSVHHRTVSGAPPDSIRCTREPDTELATFGNSGSHSAIIHRTVRCASGVTATQRQRLSVRNPKCATVHACARRSQDRHQKAHRTVNSDCPVAHMSEAPMVRIQRPGDVAGAPDSVRCAMRQKPPPTTLLVVGAINTPNHPPFIASKYSAFTPHTRAIAFNTRHKQRDQILSQVRNHSNQISDERERHLCSFELLRLDCFFIPLFLVLNSLVIKTRDTKLWWSL